MRTTSDEKSDTSPSHGLFSRLHLTVECATAFGQTVHVSGSSLLAGLSYPSLVGQVALMHQPVAWTGRFAGSPRGGNA